MFHQLEELGGEALNKHFVFAVKWNCSKGAPKSERAIGE